MISLIEYFNPKQEIIEAVDKLSLYYQLYEQESLNKWNNRENKNSLSGKSLDEFLRLVDIDEFIKFKDNIVGHIFLKARFLLDKFSNNFNVQLLKGLSNDESLLVTNIIKDGLESKNILEDWLKPLTQGEIEIAINDALTVDIDKKFQILKIEQIYEHKGDEKKNNFKIYPYILDIESAAEMVHFLRIQSDIKDCLILTLQRNNKYQWKSNFYLFFIYKGILYNIDNSDRRLNIYNTEGCRNPDRYLENKYDKIWLPIRVLSNKNKSNETNLIVKGAKVYKIDSLDNITKDFPETVYWLYIFIGRVINYINTEKIEIGVTINDNTKLLDYSKNKLVIERSGAGSYLEEIYASKCKDIVVQEKHLPNLIGTHKFIQDVVGYKKRELIADILSKAVKKDYKINSSKVYTAIRSFIKEYPINELLKEAALNKKYSYMHYAGFADIHETGMRKNNIMRITDNCLWQYTDKNNVINIAGNLYSNYRKRTVCIYDKKFQWKKIINLDFIDYRQFIEFFKISEDEIPIQMKQHLHQQSKLYVGNSILDDTDPVDKIDDPWFKEKTNNNTGGPLLRIAIPMCNRCLKKLGFTIK